MAGGRFPKSNRPRIRGIAVVVGVALAGAVLLVFPIRQPLEPARVSVPLGVDTVRVAPGARYGASGLKRLFLGTGYRRVWAEPIGVPVLRLTRFDGGLQVVREGGGMETRSLYFVSDSLRHWIFRSLDKEPVRLLPPSLQRSLLAAMVQDQVSAEHPGGTFVGSALQRVLGLPSAEVSLVALPDHERLGPHRLRFAGLVGTLQEAPGPAWTGLEGGGVPVYTDVMLGALDGQPVDATGFLTARLLDFLLNDWDRHPGQWRWVPLGVPGGVRWHPIPVDRDQALSSHGGLLVGVARIGWPQLVAFGPAYPSLRALTANTRDLDPRLLAGLSRRSWDSVVEFVRVRLSDRVIDSAVARMPEPWWRVSGAQIAGALKARRDRLPEIAERFYRQVH
ncbi:MAG: hypothetical protein ACT4PM_10820 [Gemmatimonadales bacterium]